MRSATGTTRPARCGCSPSSTATRAGPGRRSSWRGAFITVAVAEGTGDHGVEAAALDAAPWHPVHDRLGEQAGARPVRAGPAAVGGGQDARRRDRGGARAGADRQHLGDRERADTLARHAAELARARGSRVLEEGQGALTALAGIDLDRGRPDRALEHARRALEAHRTTGHRIGRARTLLVRGRAHADAGQHDQARTDWQEAR